MEELTQLKGHIQRGELDKALDLVDDLEHMSRKGDLAIITSQLTRLVAHLIKKAFEKRLTNSWRASINDASTRINLTNESRDTRNSILSKDQMRELIIAIYDDALIQAVAEIDNGVRSDDEIQAAISSSSIVEEAMAALYDQKNYISSLIITR
jgi:hypothetical protein